MNPIEVIIEKTSYPAEICESVYQVFQTVKGSVDYLNACRSLDQSPYDFLPKPNSPVELDDNLSKIRKMKNLLETLVVDELFMEEDKQLLGRLIRIFIRSYEENERSR